jgi:hypothetical protein
VLFQRTGEIALAHRDRDLRAVRKCGEECERVAKR